MRAKHYAEIIRLRYASTFSLLFIIVDTRQMKSELEKVLAVKANLIPYGETGKWGRRVEK